LGDTVIWIVLGWGALLGAVLILLDLTIHGPRWR
jgi:hypothetical protein